MFQKGEVILEEKPFTFILKSTLRTEKCEFCFSPAQLKCSRCQYWRYCNKSCQKLAWTMHKLECDNLKKIIPKNVPDTAHIMIRILLRLKTDSADHSAENKGSKRPFQSLMSHANEIKNDRRRMEHFTSIAFVIRSFFGENESFDEAYLLELFGKVCINSFNIMDNDMNSVGTGIYLNASVLDHSCDPNAVAVFHGTTIFIRSISDIPDFHLNEVRISYIDVLNLSCQRRKELQSMYYFSCDCKRCVNETYDDLMQSIKCFNGCCSGFISLMENLENKYICGVCCTKISEEMLKEYHEVTQLSDYHLHNMHSSDGACIDICEMILLKQKNILSDLNVHRIKMLDLAFEACINFQRWSEAMEFGLQLLPGFRKYYGLYHPLVGLLNMKLLKIILLQKDQDKCIQFYDEASKILSITHGRSHPLFEALKEIMYC